MIYHRNVINIDGGVDLKIKIDSEIKLLFHNH